MSKNTIHNSLWLVLSILVVVMDQASKYCAMHNLVFGLPEPLISNLSFTLNYNKGIAFGLLTQYQSFMQIGLIAMVMVIIMSMTVWLFKTPKNASWQAFSLSLIIGGAIGNLIDRIFLGHVVDFIDFYVGHWHWPTFNIADVFVCAGAFILAICAGWATEESGPIRKVS